MKEKQWFVGLLILLLAVSAVAQDESVEQKKKQTFELELSFGMFNIKPNDALYDRISGIYEMVRQYALLNDLQYSTTGSTNTERLKSLIPVALAVHFDVFTTWWGRAGIEYSSGSSSSSNNYQLFWPGVDERHEHGFSYKIRNLTPFVGFEKRFPPFGIYANIGLNFLSMEILHSFKYSETVAEPQSTYWHSWDENFKVKSSNPVLIVGARYTKRIYKRFKLSLKIEFMFLKVQSLEGEKIKSGLDFTGQTNSDYTKGTMYLFETNPLNSGWFSYWDMFASTPGVISINRNPTFLGLGLNALRFLLSISF